MAGVAALLTVVLTSPGAHRNAPARVHGDHHGAVVLVSVDQQVAGDVTTAVISPLNRRLGSSLSKKDKFIAFLLYIPRLLPAVL